MNHKTMKPRYYNKNIIQQAQRRYLQRKAMEANREKRRERPADAVESGKKE